MSIKPTIPVKGQELKLSCRLGLSKKSREYWWPLLASSNFKDDSVITEYPDFDSQASRFVELIQARMDDQESEEDKFEAIMTHLQRVKRGIEEPILIEQLIKRILECIQNVKICVLVSCELIENNEKYIVPKRLAHLSRLASFKELLRRYMPKTSAVLDGLGALQDQYLNLMFIDMFRTLLPQKCVLAMLDAFFFEGSRILFRYGLALLKTYKARIKSGEFRTANQFWLKVQEDSLNASATSSNISNKKLEALLINVKDNAFDLSRSTLQKLFRPMNISTSNLIRLNSKSSNNINGRIAFDPKIFTCIQGDPLFGPDLDSAVTSKELGDGQVGERSVGLEAGFIGTKSITGQDGTESLGSEILNECLSLQLLSLLPYTMSYNGVAGLQVAFSTAHHGFSLETLYERTKGLSACILLLKVMPELAQDFSISTTVLPREPIILGGFLASGLSPPRLSARGDGQSFVFRLDATQDALKYDWVGNDTSRNDGTTGLHRTNHEMCATEQQFAVCSPSFISFGASSFHCTNAFRIDSDLQAVDIGVSDTYGNPCLTLDYATLQRIALGSSGRPRSSPAEGASQSPPGSDDMDPISARATALAIEVLCQKGDIGMQQSRSCR